jgi:hypothetical protein
VHAFLFRTNSMLLWGAGRIVSPGLLSPCPLISISSHSKTRKNPQTCQARDMVRVRQKAPHLGRLRSFYSETWGNPLPGHLMEEEETGAPGDHSRGRGAGSCRSRKITAHRHTENFLGNIFWKTSQANFCSVHKLCLVLICGSYRQFIKVR